METHHRTTWSPPQAPVPSPTPWHATSLVTTQMCAALGDEIAAASKRRRLVELEPGVRVLDSVGPFLYYRFPNAGGAARPGTTATLLVNGQAVPVTVLEHEDPDDLQVAALVNLGESVPTAQLDVGLIWLLEALRDRLRHLPSTFNAPLALAAVGASPMPSLGPDVTAWDVVPGLDRVLDEEKLNAVAVALRAPVGFVWGPPGTGKTTTVAATVEAHLMEDRRVLVVTPTNASADEVALRTTQWLERGRSRWGLESALQPGTVVRLGRVDDRVRAGCRTPIEVATLTPEVLAKARVLVTTLHQAHLRPEFEGVFDAVLVDEAGAAMLPQLFWAAGLARRQVTCFGDFRQLGPVVQSDTRTAQWWLRRDVFAAAGITEAVERGEEDPPHLAVLKTQYRMHPEIGGLVSELFYGRRLETAVGISRRPAPPCWAGSRVPITLIDTTGYATSVRNGKGGRENQVHVEAVQRLLASMEKQIPSREDVPGDSIAVLAPFRAQVTLHRRIWRKAYRSKAVGVATVHMYQGGEVDVVVLDLADGPGTKLSRFMQAGRLTDAGARLLNVSLSRARHRLIVLADVRWLSAEAPRHGVVAAFLAALQARAEDARVEWIPLSDLLEDGGVTPMRAPPA